MKNNKAIIGIDPGHKGAIAVFSEGCLDVWDMKNFRTLTGNFHSLDPSKLFSTMRDAIPAPDNAVAYCEESLLVRGNGIKTARPVFVPRGVLRAVFALLGLEVRYVAPTAWKRFHGLLKTDKAASVEKAIEHKIRSSLANPPDKEPGYLFNDNRNKDQAG